MSNSWELTSKERIALVSLWIKTNFASDKDAIDLVDMVQKAVLKKLVEWGNEECWEHEDKYRIALRKTMEELDTEKPHFPRHFCYKCWQAPCKGVK